MAGKNDGPSNQNTEALWAVLIACIAGALVLIWFLAKPIIVYAAFSIKLVQIKLRQMTVGLGDFGQRNLDFVFAVFDGRMAAEDVRLVEFQKVMTTVGEVVKVPMAVIIAVMALWIILKMKGDGFKRSFSLSGTKGPSLIKEQANHWRTLATSANFDPDKAPKGFEPAKTPLDWLHDNKIVLNRNDNLDIEACEKHLKKQLGAEWRSLDKLPLHVRALVAICAAHGGRHKGALKVREDIAVAYATLGGDKQALKKQLEEIISPILSNEKLVKPVHEAAEKHAYITTAMIRVLQQARDNAGVLASAEFLWLKGVDRTLWYTMNNVGRNVFHVECSGVFSHFFFERVAQTKLIEPRVDKAVEGIAGYIEEQGIEDLEEFMASNK